jgi:ATP-binding cassette, subfamily G (WHITE), eye pigment precursor transporter
MEKVVDNIEIKVIDPKLETSQQLLPELSNIDGNNNLNSKYLTENNKPITLSWSNITVKLPIKSKSIFSRQRNKDEIVTEKIIVNNVDGIAKPNKVLAIMGASGAGKTTLLNCLNFRNAGTLIIDGDIKVNGHLVKTNEQISSISGYVQQEDLFVNCLTVKETLLFHAMLRMGEHFTIKDKRERVEECLIDLNLKKCEDSFIGLDDKKGISGGEKRRLSFALEILTNPMILFCDEPTSGLDSFMAMSIVDSLNNLANKGKTIICTIHQPSSEIYEKFDNLCLMAEGRLAYIGSLTSASSFFSNIGHPVPNNYNPSDFYINTLAIAPNNKQFCLERVNKICDNFEQSSERQLLSNEIEKNNQIDTNQKSVFKQVQVYKASIVNQLHWVIWRNVRSLLRNPMALRVQLAQSVFIGLIFGMIYYQVALNQTGIQNINGVMFLLLTQNSFGSLFVIVNTFTSEMPIFYREHQNGMYRVVTYYLSRILTDVS